LQNLRLQSLCGIRHDRDLNAALNIRSEGLKLIASRQGMRERFNARGPDVRLPHLGAAAVEANPPVLDRYAIRVGNLGHGDRERDQFISHTARPRIHLQK
jgi:hypothetical protein